MSYALIIDVYSIILTLLTPSEFISPINIDLASSFLPPSYCSPFLLILKHLCFLLYLGNRTQ